jgi:hypothetical protein
VQRRIALFERICVDAIDDGLVALKNGHHVQAHARRRSGPLKTHGTLLAIRHQQRAAHGIANCALTPDSICA